MKAVMRINEPEDNPDKKLLFMTGVRDDIRDFPDETRKSIGHALWKIESGETPDNVSPFEGSKANEVMKIVERYDGDTYRVVYAAKFEKAVYVLHAFKKKSTSGRATPKKEIDTVMKRLHDAKEEYRLLFK